MFSDLQITFGPVDTDREHPAARQRLRECHALRGWRPATPASVESTKVHAPAVHPGTPAACDLFPGLPAADAVPPERMGFPCMWRAAGLARPCVRNTIHRDTGP